MRPFNCWFNPVRALAAAWITVTVSSAVAAFPELPSIYVHYAADNPSNIVVAPLQQSFTPSDVDTVNQKLLLPDLGFAAIVYPNGIGPATPVYFSSTGILPAPLQASTPYYVVPTSGGGYKVYPVATDADAPIQPGGVAGEKVLPAQNVSQSVGSILFTTGGTGTHTLTTKPLVSQLTDLTTNGFNSVSVSSSNKHAFLELDTDATGHAFLRTAGVTARENFVGSYNAYGQVFLQRPSSKRFEARQQVGGKRVVYQVFVGRVRSFKERQVVKFLAGPAQVSASTDQITYNSDARMTGKIVSGDLVIVKAYTGSTLPAPLAEGVDYYARRVDTGHLTLHSTVADATNNVNAIDLTTPGSSSFLFWCPARVGDSRRWSFFAEVLAPDSGGNTLSVRLSEPLPSAASILKIASAFTTSGANNGNITGFATVPELSPVVLWAPPRAVLPAPLQAGVRYWTTRSPGSGTYGRLHDSLESAINSTGKTTSASSCIKYTAGGTGEMLTSYDDDASAVGFGTLESALEPHSTRVPLGPLCVLVFKIDFDDPAQPSALATLGVNAAVTETKLLGVPKGPTPAATNDSSAAWTLFNSAQGHVPIDLDCYEVVFGSSTNAVPDGEIQILVDFFKAKYGIGRPVLQIDGAGLSEGAFRMRFVTQTGVVYTAEVAETLMSNAWQTLLARIEGTGSEVQLADTNIAAGCTRFYRVAEVP